MIYPNEPACLFRRQGKAGRQFTLTAEIPLAGAALALAVPESDGWRSPRPGIRLARPLPMTRSPQTTGRAASLGADGPPFA